MEINREFLEERIGTFNEEIARLEGNILHVRGMRDACIALIQRLDEKPPEEAPK
jgi:uncharacterized small protein (DUF1192 family)